MIKQMKFDSILTGYQERALEFWTDKVGFKVATDQPMGPGKRWIELTISGAQTKMVLFTQDGQEDRIGSFFNGAFACDDVEYTYGKLQERGVEFGSAPEKERWGAFATFKDPDDNTFVLSSA